MENLRLVDFFEDFKESNFLDIMYSRFTNQGRLSDGEKYKAVFEIPGNHFINDETGEEHIIFPDEEILDFKDDFIPKKIKIKADNCHRFCEQMHKKLSNNPNAWYVLLNDMIEDLENDKYFFQQADFLESEPEIQSLLIQTIDDLILKLQPSEYLEPPIEISKIKLNLKKSEIAFLFYWFKEFEFLENDLDYKNLSKKINEHFMRRVSLDKNTYINIADISPEFTRIKNDKVLPSKKLVNFLKEVLQKYNK